jgi:outer membrane protein TolC
MCLRRARLAVLLGAALLIGCAGTVVESNQRELQQLARERLGSELRWLTTDEARRQARADVDAVLARPLTADDAVRIALTTHPGLQAALFQGAAESAAATQSARLPNPVFTFERLVRNHDVDRDLEIGRLLSFSVLDLVLWPQRLRKAEAEQQRTRLQLAGDVVQAAADARQAWIHAVAARQSLQYAQQVHEAADASAELARRMQSAGNFSKLQRAREQAFSAEAVAQLARAQRRAEATREALVRALGLDADQAAALRLPDRLPDLPQAPRESVAVSQAAVDQRIDIALARAELEATAREQGATRVTGLVNALHLGVARNSETGLPAQKGFELEVALPLFDFGDAARTQAQAATAAAMHRVAAATVRAGSQLRDAYGSYRGAWELARHYRDEVVPLRKAISDENLLRYNGMLIGVFELLADAREQVASVMQAIDAERDFWLADAALQAALIGRPIEGPALQARTTAAPRADAH